MDIKLCDIAAIDAPYRGEIDAAIKDCIDNSHYIGGEKLEEFEQNFADYIGRKYCIGVSNCTNAIFLTLKALGIKIGDKVLCPTMTVTADVEAIMMTGATPVFYDDSKMIHIDKKIKAIIVVHLYGNDYLWDEISRLAKFHKWQIIEDCAQSTGSVRRATKLGSRSIASCFSFFPTKILGCYGDGGAVLTNNKYLLSQIRAMRNHGRLGGEKYIHHHMGYNFRLDTLQAAILNVKLKHLDKNLKLRKELAIEYNERLKGVVKTPEILEGIVFYMYVIRCEKRDELQAYLKRAGIGTGVHYPVPLHRQPPYKRFAEGSYWNAEESAKKILSLPFYPNMTVEQVEYVCNAIREFYNG